MFRLLVPVATTCLAGLTLAACSSTTQTQTCKNGQCEIHLNGKGSVVKLAGDGNNDLELISASGDSAKVRIGKATGTLNKGVPINRNRSALTLVAVEGEDDIKLTLDTTAGDFRSPAVKSPSDAKGTTGTEGDKDTKDKDAKDAEAGTSPN